MLERVRKSLRSECQIDPSITLVIGVSGGADSVCLLDILHKFGYRLIVAHLDHQLRTSSHQEAQWVQILAEKYSAEFKIKRVDVVKAASREKKGIEETARDERYRFLFSIADENQADAVAVAHQADDQVETILMNLVRGAGMDGLAGMRNRSLSSFHPSIPLVRPLLSVWREEIIQYCDENSLAYAIDESNQDISYSRNRVRHLLIPYLMEYNPNIKQTISRMGSVLAADYELLKKLAAEAENEISLNGLDRTFTFKLDRFASLELGIQRLIIKRILEKKNLQPQIINMHTIEKIQSFFCKEIQSPEMRVASGLSVLRVKNKGIITLDADYFMDASWPVLDQEISISLSNEIINLSRNFQLHIVEMEKRGLTEDIHHNRDGFRAYLDKDTLVDPLQLRTWQSGDRFQPMGMRGKSIKMSDFWIDRKVPGRARHKWPLLFSGQTLAWVPGFQPSFHNCVSEKTRKVIVLSLKRVKNPAD